MDTLEKLEQHVERHYAHLLAVAAQGGNIAVARELRKLDGPTLRLLLLNAVRQEHRRRMELNGLADALLDGPRPLPKPREVDRKGLDDRD